MRGTLEIMLVCALATFRLTRLVVRDSIFDRPRAAVVARAPEWLVELITCPWCISAYLALGTVLVANVSVSVPAPAVTWMATWGLSTLVYQWSDTRR